MPKGQPTAADTQGQTPVVSKAHRQQEQSEEEDAEDDEDFPQVQQQLGGANLGSAAPATATYRSMHSEGAIHDILGRYHQSAATYHAHVQLHNQSDVGCFMPPPPVDQLPEHLVEVDFSDLFTGPGYHIPQTEMRATSLDQLDLVMKHVTRRLTEGEVWKVGRFQNGQMVQTILTEPAAVQLYDVCTHAIIPATAALQLSLVEAMATSSQKPSYFVSHW